MKKILNALATLLSYCEHPMIVRREDGGTYCTECGARVA